MAHRYLHLGLLFALLLLCLPPGGLSEAQSTAKGRVLAYNDTPPLATLDLDASDLRFNGIDPAGGLVSLSAGGAPVQAYLLPAGTDISNIPQTLQTFGADPDDPQVPLVLILGRSTSFLATSDGRRNPLALLDIGLGDEISLQSIAPLPPPSPLEARTLISQLPISGEVWLAMSETEAAAAGLIPGQRGEVILNGARQTFLAVAAEEYRVSGEADLYLMPLGDGFMQLIPPPETRNRFDVGGRFGLSVGGELVFSFSRYDWSAGVAGRVLAVQAGGMEISTDIPPAYLDSLGLGPGAYAVVILNGRLRAALVMDAAMLAASQVAGGLSSNYILLIDEGGLRLIYTLGDGRTAGGIFAAQPGDPLRLRPAQAIETIVREEAVVKAVAEIAPEGYLYTDISPFELSYLGVLVGQYVELNINGISYRARIVDGALLAELEAAPPSDGPPADPILLYLAGDHVIITQRGGDNLTAEARFGAAVGSVVVVVRGVN